jgi:hypothetical protein
MNRKLPLICSSAQPRASQLSARGRLRSGSGTLPSRLGAFIAVGALLGGTACNDSLGPSPADSLEDSGQDEPEVETDETTDPTEAADDRVGAREDADAAVEEDEDSDTGMVPFDAGPDLIDAGPVAAGDIDATQPLVITAPMEVKEALCSDAYDSVKLMYESVTRGSWQANPGGTFMKLSAPGYPCAAFLQEKKMRPAINDLKWTDAVDGAFVGFSEPSSISTHDYSEAQFRYFRSFIFVPKGANLKTLSVHATGIDDSLYLELTNTRYPMGVSPSDVGPSDPMVGACQGNGAGEWDLAKYVAEGEINVLLLVHADLSAATSTLVSVDIRADGAPIQLVSCKK